MDTSQPSDVYSGRAILSQRAPSMMNKRYSLRDISTSLVYVSWSKTIQFGGKDIIIPIPQIMILPWIFTDTSAPCSGGLWLGTDLLLSPLDKTTLSPTSYSQVIWSHFWSSVALTQQIIAATHSAEVAPCICIHLRLQDSRFMPLEIGQPWPS